MAAGLVREEQEGPGVTVVTVPDTVWALHIPGAGEEDPLSREPVFQRQVVSSQVVAARIDGSQAGRVKTVGGRSLGAAWGNLEQFFEAIFCFLLHLLLRPLAMELCCR